MLSQNWFTSLMGLKMVIIKRVFFILCFVKNKRVGGFALTCKYCIKVFPNLIKQKANPVQRSHAKCLQVQPRRV